MLQIASWWQSRLMGSIASAVWLDPPPANAKTPADVGMHPPPAFSQIPRINARASASLISRWSCRQTSTKLAAQTVSTAERPSRVWQPNSRSRYRSWRKYTKSSEDVRTSTSASRERSASLKADGATLPAWSMSRISKSSRACVEETPKRPSAWHHTDKGTAGPRSPSSARAAVRSAHCVRVAMAVGPCPWSATSCCSSVPISWSPAAHPSSTAAREPGTPAPASALSAPMAGAPLSGLSPMEPSPLVSSTSAMGTSAGEHTDQPARRLTAEGAASVRRGPTRIGRRSTGIWGPHTWPVATQSPAGPSPYVRA
mmetsp:Transcript_9926/g.27950  ORF Transcript_9926/g.27950 Transcript_9926/m.27950 type:complete len:313 (-) Transcript_9926:1-939(-)